MVWPTLIRLFAPCPRPTPHIPGTRGDAVAICHVRADLTTICLQLPGVRCPTCAAKGNEVWVIPGRACGDCGTACYES
ncbi:hypothetical protein B0H67DRAFT_473902 [Lasiosphaeris hirsuta]|uniref:Uncharacterized protein n=1 Tax=Lasiosphaeris hirsuta TaxID=260670 RepID=A0AA40B927_9PEZI|nr:hypothetical protein B0H67DRAFT_473902 [Lasiosphaeris hirsuta]